MFYFTVKDNFCCEPEIFFKCQTIQLKTVKEKKRFLELLKSS